MNALLDFCRAVLSSGHPLLSVTLFRILMAFWPCKKRLSAPLSYRVSITRPQKNKKHNPRAH
jgi:hypothetical protein